MSENSNEKNCIAPPKGYRYDEPAPAQEKPRESVKPAAKPQTQPTPPTPPQPKKQPPTQKKQKPQKTSVTLRKTKSIDIVAAVFCVAGLVIQLAAALMFGFGAVGFFNDGVTAVTAVNLIIALFRMNLATVYRSLTGGAVGAAYFVVLVFVVKNFVGSIRKTVAAFKSIRGRVDGKTPFGGAMRYTVNSCACMTALFIASGLLAPSDMTALMAVILALGGVALTAHYAVNKAYEHSGAAEIAFGSAKIAVRYVLLCVFVVSLNAPAARDFIYGAQALFNGNVFSSAGGAASSLYAQYVCILEPALFVAIAVTFITLFLREYTYPMLERYQKSGAKVLFSLTAVTIGLHLIFNVLVVSIASTFQISMLWDWLAAISARYLPMLLAAVALWVLHATEK